MTMRRENPESAQRGFTLVELLVVMAIIALLLSLAVPRYFRSIEKSKETLLQQTLSLTRHVLDQYYSDNGKYPDTLEVLVTRKYLRKLPFDPVTGSESSWILVPPDEPDKGGVFDIHSGAEGNARDGSLFKDW